jgi:hypothetical protein
MPCIGTGMYRHLSGAEVLIHTCANRYGPSLKIARLLHTESHGRNRPLANMVRHSVHLCPHATHVTKMVVASSADRVCNS